MNSTTSIEPADDEAWDGNATNVTLVTREQWNARVPDPPTELFTVPPKLVVIAHTAGRTCPSVNVSCKEIVRLTQSGHMALGWKDIGYNFLVGGDGQVYAGTSWNYEGRHSLNDYNKISIGVAFIGNFNKAEPTIEQIEASRTLINVGFLLGKLNSKAYVVFQSQIRPFSSPGVHVENVIKQQWPWWSPLGVKDPDQTRNITELFFSRSEWFAAPLKPSKKNNTFPLSAVIVYVTESNSQKNTLKTVIELQNSYLANGEDLPSNFIISKDGCIFEVRGWDRAGAHSEEGESQSIEIQMLVKATKPKIKKKMERSLNLILEAGVTQGRLTANYQIHYLTNASERVLLNETDVFSSEIE